jgi:glycosyltransferase involved in cell wall biosynthesis
MKAFRIILADGNPPWVQSLMRAVAAQGAEVVALRPSILFNKSPVRTMDFPHYRELGLRLPGWSRCAGLSTALVARRVRKIGKADAVIYTLPQYVGVAEKIRGPLSVYFAHDPFRFYDFWDKEVIAKVEQRMLDRSDIVFAIADALAEDFRKITRTRVETLRNAASRSFIDCLRGLTPPPADLMHIRRPIVGCVGQLNQSSYDWALIAALSKAVPEISLVFVGPIFNKTPRIERVLDLPNVRWLGPRPHDQLPSYLNGFDICLNPLVPGEHSDRRSPLRLYDYLATDKPILSTAIREAYLHQPFVEIGRTTDECVSILRRLVSDTSRGDVEARHCYIEKNTWEARAAQLLQTVTEVMR